MNANAHKSRMHYEYHTRREHTLERIVLNMLETHRNVRELASYYQVPKSTLYDWLKSAERYLPPMTYILACRRSSTCINANNAISGTSATRFTIAHTTMVR